MRVDLWALYQKSMLGGLGGLFGWALITWLGPDASIGVFLSDLMSGALIGVSLGACCGAWDGLFRSKSLRRAFSGAAIGAGIGLVGGMIGLLLGELIFAVAGGGLAPRAVGWAIFGAFVGANEGIARGMRLTTFYGSYGGFLGGLIGGSTYESLFGFFRGTLEREAAQAVGGAVGLVLLGLFIGALIGLVEDLFRTAWLLFTSGRLEGQTRTLDSTKQFTKIGRSEVADICILGDPQLAHNHARIASRDGEFVIEAQDGEVLVGQSGKLSPVTVHQLQSGETIQVGSSRAQFHTRSVRS